LLVAGGYYHVINRGNDRSTVFHGPAEYQSFLGLVAAAQERIRLELLAFCLMPNHFHMVVSPREQGHVSRWMHWLLTTHTHRYHLRHGTSGRVWQGRFKAFPIKHDGHLLAVLRYVERNALRSGLVDHAEKWRWGSLALRLEGDYGDLLADPPVALPRDWPRRVNEPQTPTELEALRTCVNREHPFGDDPWVNQIAWRLSPATPARPRGRPPKNR
jgi:putative transposase